MFRHVLPNPAGAEVRPLLPSHTRALMTLIDVNRAYLRRWLPCLAAIETEDEVGALIADAQSPGNPEDGYVLGVWQWKKLVGMVGFNAIDPGDRSAEVGYWLGAPYQGRGLMTNAVRVLIDDAFTTMHLRRIVILCAVGNVRSAAVAKRLGFRMEGVAREAEWLNGAYADDEIYAIHACEWVMASAGRAAA